MLIDFVNTYGLEIIHAIALALFGLLGMAIKRVVCRYLDTDTERKIAGMAVGFVEQTFKELHGPEKLRQALSIASQALAHRKIIFDENELRQMIEAAVNEMNRQAAGITIEPVELDDLDELTAGDALAADRLQ